MKLDFIKGEPVFLRDTQSQEFIGEVKSINKKLGRIVLKRLVQLPAGITISGYRNFDRNEIVEIRSAKFEEINGDIALESSESEPCNQVLSTTDQQNVKNVTYSYIKDFNSDYHSSLSVIRESTRIGFVALDTSKGRHKRASIIAVSTPTDIFVFDLLIMGDELFDEGLREVLQSPEVEKVIHDSRMLSDCLKVKHAVSLENVRDLEAEDIMVVHQDRKTVRRHRRTLEYLIKVYLGDDVEGLENKDDWGVRPLNKSLLQRLANATSFLIPLQEAIERKYMKKLIDASRVYYTYVRDLDFCDFLHYEHEMTLRKEMINIVTPKGDIRGDCRQKLAS